MDWNVFPLPPFQWLSTAPYTGFFPGKKGLRQGDLMSPALFLLCMKFFSRLIKRKTSNSEFNFNSKCEKLKITHLLFADDLILFFRGDLPSIHILMECLREFRNVSGLAVNTTQSSIFRQASKIMSLMEFLQGQSLLEERFSSGTLAFPMEKRLSVTDYSPLVDRIANSSSVFGSKSSHFQRLSSRRSTGSVGISFGTLREHQLLGRKFFIRRKRVDSVSRHIKSWNNALLARVLWKIHRKADMLWVQWINNVYLRGVSIWDWQPKKGDSPLLQRLADIRNRVVTAFGSSEATIQHMSGWSMPRDSRRPKPMSTSGRNSQDSLGKQQSGRHLSSRSTHSSYGLDYGDNSLHATDLRSYKRKNHARCASTPMNRPSTFSLSVPSVTMYGLISSNGLASTDVCPPTSVRSSGSRTRRLAPLCRTKRDISLWHARSTAFGGTATKSSLKSQFQILRIL
ncbi:UNVERIFIED_CONTAM: hypothetical protein Slati_4297100 [Sesamum latifolium]|uniref:Reverse transcriptase domain-containing protein n=1 Tax=Sesamum latifolium TaxID=2727402 RepID=A0AAW2TDP7_9LAMI